MEFGGVATEDSFATPVWAAVIMAVI